MVSPEGMIKTIAGGTIIGLGDGSPAAAAGLASPTSVALDAAGNIYISDTGHNRIRQITNGTITTLAGTGNCCYAGDGGAAGFAQLNAPTGLLIDTAARVYVADSANNAIRVIQQGAAGSAPSIAAIANAASGQTGPVAPGEIVVIYGSGLGPAQLTVGAVNSGSAPVQLAGVVVLFNGTPAQIIYASAGQVSAIVPSGVTGPSAQVAIQYLAQTGTTVTVPLALAAPSVFTVNSSGAGAALAINADGSINGPSHAAPPGSTITLYLNGVPSQFLAGPVSINIGGQQANILNLTPVASEPGVTAAQLQVPFGPVNVVAAPVIVQVGSLTSPSGVTLTIGVN
jgi:uncharacterized protein (TIGR03437 family)